MTLLLLKLTITPAAIAAASLASRRYGSAIGGWLIGLPVTAGPVILVLALSHGTAFAGRVAVGLVVGVAAQAAFVLGYVSAAPRGWVAGLAGGTAAWAVTGVALGAAHPPLAVGAAGAALALVLGLARVPKGHVPLVRHSWLDLPLRMLLATSLVLVVTASATTLGPTLSGVATTYPAISTILAVFAHRSAGTAGAVAVYRGLLAGLFALMGFGTALALLLTRTSLADAFACALALTLAIQLGSRRMAV